jgi:hypothetical protein
MCFSWRKEKWEKRKKKQKGGFRTESIHQDALKPKSVQSRASTSAAISASDLPVH